MAGLAADQFPGLILHVAGDKHAAGGVERLNRPSSTVLRQDGDEVAGLQARPARTIEEPWVHARSVGEHQSDGRRSRAHHTDEVPVPAAPNPLLQAQAHVALCERLEAPPEEPVRVSQHGAWLAQDARSGTQAPPRAGRTTALPHEPDRLGADVGHGRDVNAVVLDQAPLRPPRDVAPEPERHPPRTRRPYPRPQHGAYARMHQVRSADGVDPLPVEPLLRRRGPVNARRRDYLGREDASVQRESHPGVPIEARLHRAGRAGRQGQG
jgi:hypothetical protein